MTKARAHDEQGEFLKFLTISSRKGVTWTPCRVCLRMLDGNPRCDRFQLGARLFDRHALFHLADALEEKIAARMVLLVHLQRHPEIANFRETPAFGHDADDRDLLAVDRNRPADDGAIGRNDFATFRSDQGDRRGVKLIFLRAKLAAENGLHPEKGKGIGGNVAAEVTRRFVATGNDEGRFLYGGNSIQGGDILFPLQVIGQRSAGILVAFFVNRETKIRRPGPG